MSNNPRHHQVDWFRHDTPVASEASNRQRLHPAEVRHQLDVQLAERRQINEIMRQQDQQNTLLSLQHEQQLLEQEKRHATLSAQEKRLKLKMDLDEQMAAKHQAKQRDRDQAAREYQEQQEILLKWQREQEDDKLRKQAQINQLALQRRIQLAEVEASRKLNHSKRWEEERQQNSTLYSASFNEDHDSARKRVFKQSAASQFVDDGALSHRSSQRATASGLSAFVTTQNTLSGYQTEVGPKPQDRTSLCRDLQVQMEDKKRRLAAEKEADRAYAQYLLSCAQSAKDEEDSRKRQVLEKNSQFRSYLEQQMNEKRSAASSNNSSIYGNAEAPSSLLATRPW